MPDETELASVVAAADTSVSRKYLAEFRLNLTQHFNREELRDLCFDMGIEHQNLPDALDGMVRELVAHCERHDRLAELVAMVSQLRPTINWAIMPGLSSTALHPQPSSHFIGRGLEALCNLMQSPNTREAVIAFRKDFKTLGDQIDILGDYKDLHDALHTLQFQCHSCIIQDMPLFPRDEMARERLTTYELTLQDTVNSLQKVAARNAQREASGLKSISVRELEWIRELVQARAELHEAIENDDAKQLGTAAWLMDRVLAIQPSQINTRLNDKVHTLGLQALEQALKTVRDNLARPDLDADNIRQFEKGVDELVSLNCRLPALINEHDGWQAAELDLRRIESNLRQNMEEIELSWPGLKAKAEPLYIDYADDWAKQLLADSAKLNNAIDAANPVKIKQSFRRYRRQAGDRFYQVDLALKRQCEDLRKIIEPLASILRLIE